MPTLSLNSSDWAFRIPLWTSTLKFRYLICKRSQLSITRNDACRRQGSVQSVDAVLVFAGRIPMESTSHRTPLRICKILDFQKCVIVSLSLTLNQPSKRWYSETRSSPKIQNNFTSFPHHFCIIQFYYFPAVFAYCEPVSGWKELVFWSICWLQALWERKG